jgi:serine/threonine protein kinase
MNSQYERFEETGKGTHSTFYAGHDFQLNRAIVIKELRPEFRSDTRIVDAFWNEGTLLAGLNHGSIVRVYGFQRESFWIAMEPLASSLADEASKPMEFARVRDVLRQVLAGLAHLHHEGRIHGQLRLSTILLDDLGNIRFCSLQGTGVDEEFPRPDELQLHTAPEILNPKHFGTPGLSSDLYCVGLLALQLLAGDKFMKLFKGLDRKRQSDPMAWSAWHASSEPVGELSEILKEIPDDLLQLVRGLTQKQVGLRITTALEALDVITPTRSGSSVTDTLSSFDTLVKEAGMPSSAVAYNSPTIFSPIHVSQPTRETWNWTYLKSKLPNAEWLKTNKKLIYPVAATLFACVFFAGSALVTEPHEKKIAKIESPNDKTPEPPPVHKAPDPKLEEPSRGTVELVALSAEDGSIIDDFTIEVDGMAVDFAEDKEPVDDLPIAKKSILMKSVILNAVANAYSIRVSAKGYKPTLIDRLVLEVDKPKKENVKLHREKVFVEVDVNVPTAMLSVDGVEQIIDQGALRLLELARGEHVIQARAEGYKTTSKVVTVSRAEKVSLVLQPIPKVVIPQRTLEIDSYPRGSEVVIDGALVGRTPLHWTGAEGTHSIEIRSGTYPTLQDRIELRRDDGVRNLLWHLDLQPRYLASRGRSN